MIYICNFWIFHFYHTSRNTYFLRLISILILVALFCPVGYCVICEPRTRQEKCGIREDATSSGNLSRAICAGSGVAATFLDARGAEPLPPRGYRRLSPRSFRSSASPLSENTRGERDLCWERMGIFFTVAYSDPGFNSKLRSRV